MGGAEAIDQLDDVRRPALEHALGLAEEHGVPVFPCKPTKAPYTEHGLLDASRSIEQIAEWWDRWPDALVGVPTGRASGLLVIDVDPDGAQWYGEHSDELGGPRVHETRRGHHLLYRAPATEVRNSASKVAPGVDVRGEGGYIVWWPASGLPAFGPDLGERPELPAWLLERLAAAPSASAPASRINLGDRIPDGKRDATLASLAGTMRRRGMDSEAIYAALASTNDARCDPPLDDRDVRRIAGSVARYPPAEDAVPPSDPLEEIRAALIADLEAGPEAVDKAESPRFLSRPRFPIAGGSLASPGGTGKSSLVIGEMVRIAADLDLYGDDVDMAGQCAFVTAEDGANGGRYVLQRAIADGRDAGVLSERAATLAKSGVRVIGWSRSKYGPIMRADEAGETHVCAVWPLLLELLAPFKPVYITLDPSVLFGPGERLGNDAAAAFAALLHETALQIGALVQAVDHVSQAVARGGIVDQYAARGGTGKIDEARLARQLVRVAHDAAEPMPAMVTPSDVAEGRVFQLHWTKLSYAPPQPPMWLRRRGYWFEHLRPPSSDEAAARRSAGAEADVLRAEAAVLAYVRERTAAGERLGKRDVERSIIVIPDTGKRLPVREAAEAVRRMLAEGKLVRRDLPTELRTGFRKDHVDAP